MGAVAIRVPERAPRARLPHALASPLRPRGRAPVARAQADRGAPPPRHAEHHRQPPRHRLAQRRERRRPRARSPHVPRRAAPRGGRAGPLRALRRPQGQRRHRPFHRVQHGLSWPGALASSASHPGQAPRSALDLRTAQRALLRRDDERPPELGNPQHAPGQASAAPSSWGATRSRTGSSASTRRSIAAGCRATSWRTSSFTRCSTTPCPPPAGRGAACCTRRSSASARPASGSTSARWPGSARTWPACSGARPGA